MFTIYGNRIDSNFYIRAPDCHKSIAISNRSWKLSKNLKYKNIRSCRFFNNIKIKIQEIFDYGPRIIFIIFCLIDNFLSKTLEKLFGVCFIIFYHSVALIIMTLLINYYFLCHLLIIDFIMPWVEKIVAWSNSNGRFSRLWWVMFYRNKYILIYINIYKYILIFEEKITKLKLTALIPKK